MFRLVAGMHHYPALESIPDPVTRARCEAAALDLAAALLRSGGPMSSIGCIDGVVDLAARLGRDVAQG